MPNSLPEIDLPNRPKGALVEIPGKGLFVNKGGVVADAKPHLPTPPVKDETPEVPERTPTPGDDA